MRHTMHNRIISDPKTRTGKNLCLMLLCLAIMISMLVSMTLPAKVYADDGSAPAPAAEASDPEDTSEQAETPADEVKGLSYTDKKVVSGKKAYYKVRALRAE